jgi:hypothetical protein
MNLATGVVLAAVRSEPPSLAASKSVCLRPNRPIVLRKGTTSERIRSGPEASGNDLWGSSAPFRSVGKKKGQK